MTLGMFVFGLGQSPLSGLPEYLNPPFTRHYLKSAPSRTRNHHCALLQVTWTRCITRSVLFYTIGNVFRYKRVVSSPWTHCWERCLLHFGTYIIPFVTMVSERAVLRLCWRHWLLVRHQPSLHLYLELAYQGSRGRARGFRASHGSEEAIGCQHD